MDNFEKQKMQIATNLIYSCYNKNNLYFNPAEILEKKLRETAEAYSKGVISAETSRFAKSLIEYLTQQNSSGQFYATLYEWIQFLECFNFKCK